MYLCRADGVSPIYVFSLPQRLSHYPLAKLLWQYYKLFKQILHFCYNGDFLYIVFSCPVVCLSSGSWKRDKHLI